jgi:quaternary ammonium compound-resistance protein SugE
MSNPWVLLFLAGLLEVGWAVGLKTNPGFTRPLPAVLTVAAILGSMWLLALAMRALPLGTAYAVWVGIGAVGTVIAGVLLHGESLNAVKVLSVLAIIGGMAGLKAAG